MVIVTGKLDAAITVIINWYCAVPLELIAEIVGEYLSAPLK
jgi:hypothetical protein